MDPVFNPVASTTYAVVPCNSDTCDELDTHRCGNSGNSGDDEDDVCQYTYTYGGNATTRGTLAVDRLAMGDDVFRGVVFGCSSSSAGGPPAQLGAEVHGFARPRPCPGARGGWSSAPTPPAVRNASDKVGAEMSTNPRYPSYYYLNLDGLSIGDRAMTMVRSSSSSNNATTPGSSNSAWRRLLPCPTAGTAAAARASTHGMIIDIASTITFLEESLYDELVDDSEEEIRLPRGSGSNLGLTSASSLPEGVLMSCVYVPCQTMVFEGD
ncbi:hypothetical protein QYE76_044369 [Lolium multiflorum]|uniref:Xylanase inhibitor N-terminal domain-containing protein n=1 Tax=Lolium multiflorum TaxID=4521 RepID=A0AAD8WYT0_LOLMU|nr:hypothetical protein QYE76_044369 [Lolium multiflorum]